MAGFFLMLGEAQGEVKPLDAAKNRPSSGIEVPEKTIGAGPWLRTEAAG
jgi:hypothetical protein